MELLDVAFSSYAFVDNTETISSQSNQFFFKEYQKKKRISIAIDLNEHVSVNEAWNWITTAGLLPFYHYNHFCNLCFRVCLLYCFSLFRLFCLCVHL